MDTDLTGWAEIQPFHASAHQIPRDIRYGAIETDCIVTKNHANFSPVVGVRGIPDNLSREAQTWITWSEIAAIDWEEPAEAVDSMPRACVRGAAA